MNTFRAHFESAEPPDPQRNRHQHSHRGWRIFGWIAGSLALLILVCAVGLVTFVNTDGVHHYLLNLAQREASKKLGVRVQLQNFTLHLSTLALDLYGIRVDGAAPYQNPPLLQLDHVAVGVRIISVFGRKWYLDNLQVDHPVAWVLVDKNGVSNLPKLQNANNSGSSNTTIFDLGIRRALLDRGEVYYNSRPSALAADVHNLDFRASFNSLLTMYSGRLAYRDAHFQYGANRPFAHDLALDFDATPSTFHLKHAELTSGPSHLSLSATVNNYSNDPNVQAQYDAILDGAQLGRLLHSTSIPAGLVRTTGSAQYQQTQGRSLLQSLIVNGELTSRALAIKTAAVSTAIANLAAQYALANGDATVSNLRANLLGGQLAAQGTMKDIGGDAHSNVSATLHGISMEQVRQVVVHSNSLSDVALAGTLNASATAAWGKTLENIKAHTDATVDAQVTRSGAQAQPTHAILVQTAIHANYDGATQQFALNNSYVHTPQTNLAMNGTVGKRSSLQLQLQANDLREVATIANLFRTPSPDGTLTPIDLAGQASFQGSVQGSTSAPQITGQLTAQNLHFNGTDWKTLRTGVEISPDRASLQNADLESASQGRIQLSASAGLNHWSFTNQSPLQVQLNASQLNIPDLTRLAGKQVPITGTLNARATLHGTENNPQGSGEVALTRVTAYEQPIQSVHVNFSGSGEQARAELAVQLAGGNLHGNVTVEPRQKSYTAQLASTGIHLENLQALKAHNIDAAGAVAFNAKGHGTFDNPQIDADIQVPDLVIQGQTISAVKLNANLANHVAETALTSSVAGAEIQAKARVGLSGDYPVDASLDTKAFPLQTLLATYAPDAASQVSGETEVHATVHGPLKNKNLVEAHVTIPTLKLGYSDTIQLASAAPIRIDYKDQMAVLQPASIRGTDTDLQLQAAVPVGGNGSMSLQAHGSINLQLAQLFNPDLRSSGELKLNIDSHGPLTSGNVGGEVDIVDANLSSADLPVGLQHGNGVLTLSADRLNIQQFQGNVGGGTITAQGGVAYRPRLQFNMGVAAKGVRILYPQGMRESVDANLTLTGTYAKAFLGGSVNLADLSFTPAFDLTSFVNQLSSGVTTPTSQGFSQNVALNIAVHSSNNVNLVSRTLSVNGSANLQVRGTAAEPVILGRVNLNGGDVILHGTRFVLTGGTVQFVNPSQTQPVLNLSVNTNIQEYKIDLRFNGPADQMRTEYSSDPALPQADIIHLLAFGQTLEASAAASASNQTSAGQTAESLVASQVSSQVTSRISKAAGISQLSISPVLAGSSQQGPAGANITIQQRVTGNLFITFSTNVASTQAQTIQGQYQVTPRVAVSATRNPNGGFAVDTLIKKSW
ncbi:MAG TPA: translocation/assembly module TamB domain-containing protein [Terracidiphilus sp.]|nr:translocation/assembly module TamB domain-containing protein [Terracidiphilus sp.]